MARSFNGSSDFITIGSGFSVPSSGNPFSISVWFLPAISGANQAIIGSGTSGPTGGVTLYKNTLDTLTVEQTEQGNLIVATSTATIAAWQNAVITYDGSTTAKIFQSGSDISGTTTSRTFGSGQYDIGRRRAGPDLLWNGDICELAVWNIVLGATDIANLAAGDSALVVKPAALTGYWPLAGTASPEPDLSMGKNNAVLTGTSFVANPANVPLPLPVSFSDTTLTNVAGRYFSRRDYAEWLDRIIKENEESAREYNKLIDESETERNLTDIQRADRDYNSAEEEYGQSETALFNNLTSTNHIKFSEAKEKRDKARKDRDHQYFMEVVKKEWAKHNESKAKRH